MDATRTLEEHGRYYKAGFSLPVFDTGTINCIGGIGIEIHSTPIGAFEEQIIGVNLLNTLGMLTRDSC